MGGSKGDRSINGCALKVIIVTSKSKRTNRIRERKKKKRDSVFVMQNMNKV